MVNRPEPRGRGAYRHFATITTRWADNDVYGHINNTIYYAWFDSAVNQWLVANGMLDIAVGDPIGLVVETGCRFVSPLAFPGEVEVGIALASRGTSSVTYHVGAFAAGAPVAAAEGHFTHVYVARATRRPVALRDDWAAKLDALR